MRNRCAALRVVQFSSMLALWGAAGCDSGVPGPTGPAGADGQRRVYGDGSSGALTVETGTTLDFIGIDNWFTDVTVETGATLNVPSGTIIRCTGKFTNSGDIVVTPPTGSGGEGYNSLSRVYDPPAIGISGDQAGGGDWGDNSTFRVGGSHGSGLNSDQALTVLMPGVWGGGGGAGGISVSSTFAFGGDGGGTLVILAQGGFTNSTDATVTAAGNDGANGSGGGGGGIIIIASPEAIVNNGILLAFGGAGGSSSTNTGPGGGGGGGIVHLISPEITAGTIDVGPGFEGIVGVAMSVTSSNRVGGGGGGAGGGRGGDGGEVSTNGTPSRATDGADGFAFESPFDPTLLF